MTQWLPWFNCSPEQRQQIKNAALRFGINVESNNGYNQNDTRSLQLDRQYYNMTSYTARNSLNEFLGYLRGQNYYYYGGGEDPEREDTKQNGLLEYTILSLLADFSLDIKTLILPCFTLLDRGNTERHDPINTDLQVKLAYFPKGITDFNPENKILNEELTAKLQREIIKENGTDESLGPNSPDKTITVKVFNERPGSDKFLHVYFNKKAPQTMRRIIYKTIREAIKYFNIAKTIQIRDPENPIEKELFLDLAEQFFNPASADPSKFTESINKYIEEKIKFQDENLIELFAQRKQTAMNQTRKDNLEHSLNNARQYYERNMQEFARLKNEYIQAKRAYDSFEEVEFTAITVLLNKIKEHPGTKLFTKINNDNLQFLIEEPMIHTEPETWARILGNSNSEVNGMIRSFASNFNSKFETTTDILRYAVQRLIKELFVDQKIRVYTAALLGIKATSSDFRIDKYNLPDYSYMPHPHIGSSSLTCWQEASREISKQVMENDGETAFLQLVYALQQMTASDNVVSKKFVAQIINTDYSTQPLYIKKGTEERVAFNTLIKEFVADETNKINTIIASESEGNTI